VFEKFRTLKIGVVGISVTTLSELNYGVEKSNFPEKNHDALRRFITPLEIPDYDHQAAIEYGKIRAFPEKQGTIIGAMDLLIAAHTKSINACLVTNNLKEFSRIPDLKTENWVHQK